MEENPLELDEDALAFFPVYLLSILKFSDRYGNEKEYCVPILRR